MAKTTDTPAEPEPTEADPAPAAAENVVVEPEHIGVIYFPAEPALDTNLHGNADY